MNDSSRDNLITYRLERSNEAMREVEYLIEGGFYNSAISRLYYSCYYAVIALFISNKLEAQTHAGVKTMLSKYFVKNNLLDKQQAKTFFTLFDLRHNNDYDDFSFCDKETLEDIKPKAEEFINTIKSLI